MEHKILSVNEIQTLIGLINDLITVKFEEKLDLHEFLKTVRLMKAEKISQEINRRIRDLDVGELKRMELELEKLIAIREKKLKK